MAHTMRVRKGDLVHILSGKDRGKEGRVIDARPKDKKVIVENLNLVKRHTKPRPMRDASRMGGRLDRGESWVPDRCRRQARLLARVVGARGVEL